MSEAARCLPLKDDRAWLDCYLAAAQAMKASIEATNDSSIATSDDLGKFGLDGSRGNELLSESPDQFRLSAPPNAKSARNKPIDHITARLVKYKFSAQKYFTVVLNNGQVWQQINGDDAFADLKLPAANYAVTIKQGVFGSHNLTFVGLTGLFRVRRIA